MRRFPYLEFFERWVGTKVWIGALPVRVAVHFYRLGDRFHVEPGPTLELDLSDVKLVGCKVV